MEEIKVFDLHRIFIGDAPPLFLLEIVFRTLIMYGYTILLLRLLGKREMGQLSMLELAIIIAFGSAVGDPMFYDDVPILHGMAAITTVTLFQRGTEWFINKNKKAEAFLEGKPSLIVENGVIDVRCLDNNNVSKEDLLRSLRQKDIQHLGEVKRAFFETSGKISVMFNDKPDIKPGLTVMPENMLDESAIIKEGGSAAKEGIYCCLRCGHARPLKANETPAACELCEGKEWMEAEGRGNRE